MEKKDIYKFTIQFNSGDPQHQKVAEVLNQQGRRKAQFIVNTVLHYLHCSETPNIPEIAPIAVHTIETLVRRILEEHSSEINITESRKSSSNPGVEAEHMDFGEMTELLGKEGVEAIRNTMASFRR